MIRGLAALCVPLVAACATAAGRPEAIPIHRDVPAALPAIALRNAGFEAPPRSPNHCAERWDCSAHADPGSYSFFVDGAQAAEGRQSLCIERVGKEPWAVVAQAVREASIPGASLRLSMMLRLAGTTGPGAGPWVILHGPSGRLLKHEQRLFKATDGWQHATLDIEVMPGTEIVEVGMTLEGPGRACMDDVRLEVVRAKAAPGK